jgi:hypothetical protein
MITNYLIVFFLGLSLDLAYAWYIKAVHAGHKLKAGILSVMVALPALFGFVEVYDDRIAAIPYCLGLFCGTILALHFEPIPPNSD